MRGLVIMGYICFAVAIIVPYLICSINPAIIVAKIKSGKDIRELGSGGAGLTNALRTQGKKVAIIVLLCDVLKGVVSILLIMQFYRLMNWYGVVLPMMSDYRAHSIMNHTELFVISPLFLWLGSLSAVLGHCYPIWHKFKGGKAVLVTVATGLVINWLAALIALSLFIIIVLLTKYVSLGSIIAAIAYPICVWFFGTGTIEAVVICSAITAILIFKHRENIKRLITGTENKLGEKK
jgi:glycerol-3-phosphate acyltransferase PlsY